MKLHEGFARLFGQMDAWPSKHELAEILCAAGIPIYVGRISIRVENFDEFIFRDLDERGWQIIDASAISLESLLAMARRVSNALTSAALRHRFEIYNYEEELAAYLHFQWPQGVED
ncbi:MAG: hypothetical protein KDC71_21460 [Acidobacteria bacterium]|nr:hypothetical protein [Acidobacteriota bacterium]